MLIKLYLTVHPQAQKDQNKRIYVIRNTYKYMKSSSPLICRCNLFLSIIALTCTDSCGGVNELLLDILTIDVSLGQQSCP